MSQAIVELEPAFVLHVRPWQETSQILEVFGAGHGRTGLVARGARRPSSRWRSVLQPFQPVRLSWSGRGALHTLRIAEPVAWTPPLEGLGLMAAFYLNELLLNFLRRGDPHPALFSVYAETLAELRGDSDPEPALRKFELRLLAEIGYGLNLDNDVSADRPLDPESDYEYLLEHGPVPASTGARAMVFSGAELLGIARCEFDDVRALKSAKRLLRAVLNHYLGGRSLRSREVLAAMLR